MRRAARTVLDALFSCLTAWLAPILCFTAEEAWRTRFGEDADSVHLRLFPEIPETWRADAIAGRWETVRDVRRAVTGALERERAEKRIGSSLQAHPEIFVDSGIAAALDGIAFDEIAITSDATITAGPVPHEAFTLPEVPGVGVVVRQAAGRKCARCWKVLPEVGTLPDYPDICRRCADAVGQFGAAAE